MILDPTRRRTSPRRFLVLAAASAAAVLLPLAMLRPIAKAQAVSPASSKGLVEIASIRDAANGEGWDVNGKPLAEPHLHWIEWIGNKKFTAKPGQKALFVAFRLSPSLRNVPMVYDVSGTTLDGITLFSRGNITIKGYSPTAETMRSIQVQSSDDSVIYGAAFPESLRQTKVRVGAAIGPWATVETAIVRPILSNFSRRHYPPGKTIFSGDRMIFISLPKISEDLHEFRVIALDKKGHSLLLPDVESSSKGGSEQITARLPQGVSGNEVRIQTRPYVWTEFKDVALQPAQDTKSTPVSQNEAVPARNDATPWTSQIIKSKWQPRTTFHMALHIAPAVSGMRPEPPVTGQLVSGPGKATNFAVKAWKPGRSNFLTVTFDYTPQVADKVHPDIIHLLTKQGAVAAVITYYSI